MLIQDEKPAETLFKTYCLAYKNRDLNTLLALFTDDINIWGTALDEYRVGLKEAELQLKRDWSQSETGEVEIVSFVPAPKGANWAAAVCNARVTIAGQEHVFAHLRGTIIIAQEEGRWKIAHMHASFPDYRSGSDQSFPAT